MELPNSGLPKSDAFMYKKSDKKEEDRKSDSPDQLQPSPPGAVGTTHLEKNYHQSRKRGRPRMDTGQEDYSDVSLPKIS